MKRNFRKEKIGVVISNKMNKTIIVKEIRRVKHPYYRKAISRIKKYAAHDEYNICNEGDLVQLMETRPLSKSKRWRLVRIIEEVK
ncbi:MAG: 30S ribosomal protein S17 [Candidatus Walczuchella monophlebidarum]